jgi:hypothetical protein
LLLSSDAASRGGWRQWLATHPPLTERLSRLYGRSFEADEVLLAADRLAMDAADDDGAAALAPELIRAAQRPVRPELVEGLARASTSSTRTGVADITSPPESARHDATQMPSHFDAAERERDALRRIEQWYGIGEWQAAMLALAIDPEAPDAAARWRGYEAATADLHVANAVRKEVQSLSPGARRLVVEKLLDRACRSPTPHKRRLLREWAQRRSRLGGANTATDQWRAIVIRHAFAPPRSTPTRGTLADHADEVRAATRCMAHVLTADPIAQAQWHDAAIAALESMGLPQQRGPGIGLAPPTVPDDQRELHAALRVRRLSVMQRPLLVRAWIDASKRSTPPSHSADALHLLCLALNVPTPDYASSV